MRARLGDTVVVHYTGTLADGTEFDTSRNRGPIEFTIGKKQVISGFERAVIGMAPGTMKIENIPSSQSFGPRRPELIIQLGRDRLPSGAVPREGDQISVLTTDGKRRSGVITEIASATVAVDANHPLAGKDLTFEIQLVDIVPQRSRPNKGWASTPKGARDSKIILG